MFKVAKQENIKPVGLGNITVGQGLNGTQDVTVYFAGRTFKVLNLETKKDKNGKDYQRGDLVQGDLSYATVMVRNATLKATNTIVPMVSLYIKCPELIKQLGGVKECWALVENGKGSFSETKDSPPQPPQRQGQGYQYPQDDPNNYDQYAQGNV